MRRQSSPGARSLCTTREGRCSTPSSLGLEAEGSLLPGLEYRGDNEAQAELPEAVPVCGICARRLHTSERDVSVAGGRERSGCRVGEGCAVYGEVGVHLDQTSLELDANFPQIPTIIRDAHGVVEVIFLFRGCSGSARGVGWRG